MDIFDLEICQTLLNQGVSKAEIKQNFGLINLYLQNPDEYQINVNDKHQIEVLKKTNKLNPGVVFLQQTMFAKQYNIKEFEKRDCIAINYNCFKKNQSTYIYGNNGIGKTTSTIALCNFMYQEKQQKYLYVSWPEFVNLASSFDEKQISINNIKNVDRLIIDDLGNEHISVFTRDRLLFPIINYRLENNLETHIISNYSLDEMLQRYILNNKESKTTTTIVSKIKGLCAPIFYDGIDYRNGDV